MTPNNGEANHSTEPTKPPTTIRAIFDWYLANYPPDRSRVAFKERQRILGLFCAFRGDDGLPFGDRPHTELRAFHLLQFIKAQDGLKSPWSRKRWAVTIQVPMNEAVRLGVIGQHSLSGLRLPTGADRRDWTPAEYQSLLRASLPHFRRVLVFIRFTGARPGETRIAKWPDVDYPAKVLVIKEHKTRHINPQPRRIRLNHVALKLLLWMERNRKRGRFIFLNYFGRPWSTKAMTKYLLRLRRMEGISEEVKIHGGRHFFATRGLMNDVDLATMAALLGHRSITTTMRYTHLLNKSEYLDQAAEKAISGFDP